MLIWLASFPRSGNTMLRSLLKRGFNLDTYSIYDDPIFKRQDLAALVGHKSHAGNIRDIVVAARSEPEPVVMKTHRLPAQDLRPGDKAIYIVRDGRAALVSFRYYVRDYEKRNLQLLEVVLGNAGVAVWSRHVTAWALSPNPDVLVVRYEAIAAGDPATIAAIARHVGREPTGDVRVDFAAAKEVEPNFFRAGSDAANVAELVSTCPNMYELVHGKVAAAVGYPTGHAFDADAAFAEVAAYLSSQPGKNAAARAVRRAR